ncbi:MAG TPA: STAS domain-containing protein [Actinomycetota bacterium]
MSNAGDIVELLGPIAKQQGDLHLDLSGLSFIDSSGIHAIVKVSKEMTGSRRLLLVSPSPPVARALRLVRVDTFPNVQIVEEAAST